MSATIAYRKLLLVPGSPGVWDSAPPSEFHHSLQARLCAALGTRAASLPPSYSVASCHARQHGVEAAMRAMRTDGKVYVGHSEGGARLLHALRSADAAAGVAAVVLVSPAYALRQCAAAGVDVDAAVSTLRAAGTRVLLLDTERGFGGDDARYAWPQTRGRLTDAVRLNTGGHHTVIEGSTHSLRHGRGAAGADAVLAWLNAAHDPRPAADAAAAGVRARARVFDA